MSSFQILSLSCIENVHDCNNHENAMIIVLEVVVTLLTWIEDEVFYFCFQFNMWGKGSYRAVVRELSEKCSAFQVRRTCSLHHFQLIVGWTYQEFIHITIYLHLVTAKQFMCYVPAKYCYTGFRSFMAVGAEDFETWSPVHGIWGIFDKNV